ncbi:MAG: hypothetical protein PHU32_04090 [Candidatus ainarchaeum sp.]|nr:hypothetical protein [Candidatus ainarchaeum sp.]
MNIKKIINRDDETFLEFLKKYWWVELLAFIKIINFSDIYFYNIIIIFLGILFILWVLYRIGLE